jgi:hypothetical protein
MSTGIVGRNSNSINSIYLLHRLSAARELHRARRMRVEVEGVFTRYIMCSQSDYVPVIGPQVV